MRACSPRALGGLVLLLPVCLGASPPTLDWEAVFRSAWVGSSPAVLAERAKHRAYWQKEEADRRWLPSVSLGSESSPFMSFQRTDLAREVSGALGLTLSQRLPGGGLVSLASTLTKSWTTIPSTGSTLSGDWSPGVSLGINQPAVRDPASELAAATYSLEVLKQELSEREAFLELVQAAADLDLARQTLAWREAVEEASISEAEDSLELVRQGRGSAMALWKLQRLAERSRWERIQAEAGLQSATRCWQRTSQTELPLVEVDTLEAFAEQRRGVPLPLALEEQIARAQMVLERLQSTAQRFERAPSLQARWWFSHSSQAPTWGANLGLSVGSDFWVFGSAIEARQVETDLRWERILEVTHREVLDQVEKETRELDEGARARQELILGLARLREIRDGTQVLAHREAATRTELLTAEAELLAIALDRKKLAWQAVQLSFRLAPPSWLGERSPSWGLR